MSIIAFIFARGGSKRIPNKNIKLFAGKPLIAWTIEQCFAINEINRVIVSTDSKKIAKISKSYGAEVPFMRPKILCNDNSNEFLSWKHALNFLKKKEKKLPKYFLSVPTTAPLRSNYDIKKCIKEIKKDNRDIILTVTNTNFNPYFNMVEVNRENKARIAVKGNSKFSNYQNSPKIYGITTIAYAAKSEFILSNKNIFDSANIGVVEVETDRSIDIDNLYDFNIAEYLMKKKKRK